MTMCPFSLSFAITGGRIIDRSFALKTELRLAPSVVCPPAKSIFGVYGPIGLSYLSQIRADLKQNAHKFKHSFRDIANPICLTNDGMQDTEHFLLLCSSFDVQRRDLLAGVSQLVRPFVQINSLSNIVLIKFLLYGDKDLSENINKNILELTLNFINENDRFN